MRNIIWIDRCIKCALLTYTFALCQSCSKWVKMGHTNVFVIHEATLGCNQYIDNLWTHMLTISLLLSHMVTFTLLFVVKHIVYILLIIFIATITKNFILHVPLHSWGIYGHFWTRSFALAPLLPSQKLNNSYRQAEDVRPVFWR